MSDEQTGDKGAYEGDKDATSEDVEGHAYDGQTTEQTSERASDEPDVEAHQYTEGQTIEAYDGQTIEAYDGQTTE